MVASPSPDYAQKLGETTYQMAGLEWLAIEVIRRIDPATSLESLAGMTAHGIAEQFRSKVKKAIGLEPSRQDELAAIADEYAELSTLRTDAANARPATASDGQQQLYRWAPTKASFVGFVDHDFLDGLLARIHGVNSRLDAEPTLDVGAGP